MNSPNGKKTIKKGDSLVDHVNEADLLPLLGDSTVDKAFKDTETMNALHVLAVSDPEFVSNVFKYNIPNRQFAIAMAAQIRECEEHEYEEGINQSMYQMGLQASIGAERVKDIVQAVIGDRSFHERKFGGNGNIVDKIKGLYGEK